MKNKKSLKIHTNASCSKLLEEYRKKYPLERDPWSIADLPRTTSVSKVLEMMELDMSDVITRDDDYSYPHFIDTYNILLCYSRLYKKTKNKSIFNETYYTYPDLTNINSQVNNSLLEYTRKKSKSPSSKKKIIDC